MSDKTNIEWTESTWPVIAGCTHVSEGCRNCYAERLTATRLRHLSIYKGLATFENGEAFWNHEVRLNEPVLNDPLRWRRPRRIFVCQMSDLFHESVPFEWIDRVYGVMFRARQHTFQILTKRPERMSDYLRTHPVCAAIQNVWLGVSVEDQKTANARIPALLQCDAAVRWVSYEPALGPVDFTDFAHKINWIVAGGESGPHARPCDLEWFRAVRYACDNYHVPFFMKQLGNFPESRTKERAPFSELFNDRCGQQSAGMWALMDRGPHSNINEFPPDLRVREYPKALTSQKVR